VTLDPSEIIVVVPAYNESGRVEKVLRELVSRGYIVICINDGSSDNTQQAATMLGVTLVTHPVNLGQGASLETAFEYVRRYCSDYKVVVTFDADGQHSVTEVENMARELTRTGVDIILGSRFLNMGFTGGKIKKLIIKSMSRFARLTIGIKVSDRHNGFRALSPKALRIMQITNAGYGHADEILRIIKRKNLTYSEYPTVVDYEVNSSKSGQPIINGVRMVIDRFLGAP
jgi:glycosyltransferase involved in cell wall biosynthesis